MRCEKHNLTSLITTRVANNFLQVIYSFKNQYSYDVAMNYLTYYCYLERNIRLHTKFMTGVSISWL